jgi:hypothetical protein
MKQVFTALVAFLLLSASSFAQTQTGSYSELVFQNPVLVSGMAGKDGAVYKFSNVASGVDATVTIVGRSSSAVVLTNIDTAGIGWNKAFQPQFGIPGNVPAYQNWWMDFEMRFYVAGTTTKKKMNSFNATAIDVDGDGVSIQEYLQMNKVKSVAYCPVNYLTEQIATSLTTNSSDEDDDDQKGNDKKVLGPVQNFFNIDTAGTPVMSTYTYEKKDKISFRYGAKSGYIISNAGERLNSLWFKTFNLAAPAILPIRFYSFNAVYSKSKVTLNWAAQADENLGYFTVERSTDGSTFSAVGQLPAIIGNSSYSFNDESLPSAGIVYYRIQSKEKSGETNFSSIKVIRLNKEAANTVSVYPNPVQRTANLTLPAAWQNQPVVINVYNSLGSEVQRKTIQSASQTEALDFSGLPKGFYVVKTQCNGQWSEERIVKN